MLFSDLPPPPPPLPAKSHATVPAHLPAAAAAPAPFLTEAALALLVCVTAANIDGQRRFEAEVGGFRGVFAELGAELGASSPTRPCRRKAVRRMP